MQLTAEARKADGLDAFN